MVFYLPLLSHNFDDQIRVQIRPVDQCICKDVMYSHWVINYWFILAVTLGAGRYVLQIWYVLCFGNVCQITRHLSGLESCSHISLLICMQNQLHLGLVFFRIQESRKMVFFFQINSQFNGKANPLASMVRDPLISSKVLHSIMVTWRSAFSWRRAEYTFPNVKTQGSKFPLVR